MTQTTMLRALLKNSHLPTGFEEVVRGHFRLLRHRIMATSAGWLAEAARLQGIDDSLRRGMRAAIAELHALLAAL